jgi:hypothetical protein
MTLFTNILSQNQYTCPTQPHNYIDDMCICLVSYRKKSLVNGINSLPLIEFDSC